MVSSAIQVELASRLTHLVAPRFECLERCSHNFTPELILLVYRPSMNGFTSVYKEAVLETKNETNVVSY